MDSSAEDLPVSFRLLAELLGDDSSEWLENALFVEVPVIMLQLEHQDQIVDASMLIAVDTLTFGLLLSLLLG